MKTNYQPPAETESHYRSRLFNSANSINPLVTAAAPILIIATKLKTAEPPTDQNKFLHELAHEIYTFENRAQINGYSTNTITAARRTLCALLNEIMTQNGWNIVNSLTEENLTNIFGQEEADQQCLFTILAENIKNIATNIDLLELLYLCLSAGYQGKYRFTENGVAELAYITNKLYSYLRQHRTPLNTSLLINEQQTQILPSRSFTKTSPKKIFYTYLISIFGAILISSSIYFTLDYQLHSMVKPIQTALNQRLTYFLAPGERI